MIGVALCCGVTGHRQRRREERRGAGLAEAAPAEKHRQSERSTGSSERGSMRSALLRASDSDHSRGWLGSAAIRRDVRGLLGNKLAEEMKKQQRQPACMTMISAG